MHAAVAKQLERLAPGDRGMEELWRSIHAAAEEAGPDAATQVIKKAWLARSEQLDQAVASLRKLL
jgi:hypothetical protein